MTKNRRVIYVSRAGLPIDAAGLRIEQIGKLFEICGYTVHYLCEYHVDQSVFKNEYSPTQKEQLASFLDEKEVHFQNGQRWYSYLPSFSGGKLGAIFEMLELFTAYKTAKRVKRYIVKENPQYVVLYNATSQLQKQLLSYCRKRKVIVLGDVTEWYEKKPNATLAQKYIVKMTERRITKYDQMLDGVISISPFFHRYYSEKGVLSIQIPPLMSQLECRQLPSKAENAPVRFVYAGSPGSKDIIVPFVKALVRYNTNGIRCCIDIVGVDLQYLQQQGCPEADEGKGVFAYGHLSHSQTIDIVRNADFGILFRYNKRYAKAGFSTKFAECMSLGVGMVCNEIGGADLFVSDSEDGFLLSEIGEEAFLSFFQRVTQCHRSEIDQIKRNALIKAKRIFALNSYQKEFQKFIGKVYENGYQENY